MTREEEIANAADRAFPTKDYYIPTTEILGFTFGARWADEHPKSPWISVNEDLPCNHKELLYSDTLTKSVIIRNLDGSITLSLMYLNVEWKWMSEDNPTHWFPIPDLPKE